jgi:hypothetical protein
MSFDNFAFGNLNFDIATLCHNIDPLVFAAVERVGQAVRQLERQEPGQAEDDPGPVVVRLRQARMRKNHLSWGRARAWVRH